MDDWVDAGEAGMRSDALEAVLAELDPVLRQEGLADLFARALRDTLQAAVRVEPDGSVFVVSGDIPAMWLRDSAGQVMPYLRFCGNDVGLRQVVRGVIQRQAQAILRDPYANAFTLDPDGAPLHAGDETEHRPGVWERKWEVDSLCWPLKLLRSYVSATGDMTIYADPNVRAALATILTTFETERDHALRSTYHFRRRVPGLAQHDTTISHPVGPTGMIWGAFRPSDDGCVYNYHIPSQMFATVELNELASTFQQIYQQPRWAERAGALAQGIEAGIQGYGVVDHGVQGRVYAYEVDGLGHYHLMDDANVPSLLGLPELGYCPASAPLYLNTRQFVLSQANPYYYEGPQASGVGSPHTPAPFVWPLALIVQALTATDADEVRALLHVLRDTALQGRGALHQSFNPADPARYTRDWFGWANALFAELVLRAYYDER
jgi:uncharacterized protein